MLETELYSGAYYICGYAIECALKACICGGTNQFDFYVHPDIARRAWSHKFGNLIGLKIAAMIDACKKTRRIFIRPFPIPYMEFWHV